MIPGIANLNGKRYIVPHWIEIGPEVGIEDIGSLIPEEKKMPKQNYEQFAVPGKPYTITVRGTRATCNCMGFQFRGKCKHMTAFKETK